MKLKRILKWSAVIVIVGLAVWFETAYWTSSNDCDHPKASVTQPMKAIVYCQYGSPDVLRVEEIEKPVPKDDELLVHVHAVSINPLDWHFMEGTPTVGRLGMGLRKPKSTRLGVDYAGTVEAIGKNVTQFKPGDEVFGGKNGALAEYICPRADRATVRKPANLSFEQAASLPIAGITALQALRDQARVQSGQKVLINGASGGVGTFAVQIAKMLGAEVTGVCSEKNVDLVRSIGADQVIDYTKEDFTNTGERYDAVIDNVGTQPLASFRKVLNPNGTYVMIGGGGTHDQGFMGPLARPLKAKIMSLFVGQKMGMLFAELKPSDLTVLSELTQTGKMAPVIDKTYPMSQTAEAMRYLETGHARGKVVITVP